MKNAEIYIIQTNVSLDENNKPVDFQSMMYGYYDSWDDFKDYLLSDEIFTEKLVNGTMLGCTKPSRSTIEEVLINDDHHVKVIIKNNFYGFKTISEYMLVTKEQFSMFVARY